LQIADSNLPSARVIAYHSEYSDESHLTAFWHASATGEEEAGGYAQETYDYSTSTGNMQLKGAFTLHYDDTSHAHAATSATKEGVTNTYTYDANGNMETRVANGQSHKFHYDAENRLISVTDLDGIIQIASFEYDADGARVQSVMDGETTVFIGSHYEIANPGTNQIVTKYYLAGGVQVAMRQGETLSYLLADHIGSTSLSTDASGNRTSELRYKAFGETRFSYDTMPTRYTFTGQYSYADDPSTAGVAEGFGLYYFNARWMDPYLNRFTQPDSIVPLAPQGTQAWDRYAFVNNNPVRYNDPTGHMRNEGGSGGVSCGEPGQPSCGGIISGNRGGVSSGNPGNENLDNPPTSPDPQLHIPPLFENCPTNYSYVQCAYSGGSLLINGDLQLDGDQFNLLLISIFLDLKYRQPVGGYDFAARSVYDTPFWDSYGNKPGNVCVSDACYGRAEVNYIAQGMWAAASGQSISEGHFGVYAWKTLKFISSPLTYKSPIPSDGTLYWFDVGYHVYNALNNSYSTP
jgi:RHS repeat-associated protein